MHTYLVNIHNSNISFAVIQAETNTEIKEKTEIALKDEYCYTSVVARVINDRFGDIQVSCICTDDCGEINTVVIKLILTAIY